MLLFSGGDDGHVRAWRLSDVLQQYTAAAAGAEAGPEDAMAVDTAAAGSGAASQQPRGKQQLQGRGGVPQHTCLGMQATLDVRLPRAESGLGAISLPPAVQALAVVASDGKVVLHAGGRVGPWRGELESRRWGAHGEELW